MRRFALAIALLVAFELLPSPAKTHAGVPVQDFLTTTIDWQACYVPDLPGYPTSPTNTHPQYPDPDLLPSRSATCDPGSYGALPINAPVDAYSIITVPEGARRPESVVVFTPRNTGTQWQQGPITCLPVDTNNECTPADTGNISMRIDLFCGFGGVGVNDILATGGAGTAGDADGINAWPSDIADAEGLPPNTTGPAVWDPAVMVRTSQNPALWSGDGGVGDGSPATTSPRFFVPLVTPFPTSPTNAFVFSHIDTAAFTTAYINGVGTIPIPGLLMLNEVSYRSSYPLQPNLESTVQILGDLSRPSGDSEFCTDSPEHIVTASNNLITPNANRAMPRWAAITSQLDMRSSDQTRILDWECVTIGLGEADADGDCLNDTADANDSSQDQDSDGVPDGIELYMGSQPAISDTDTDGASDFVEMFQFTDPATPDSDGDGQLDLQDVIPTNTCAEVSPNTTACDPSAPGILDAQQTADDNCPHTTNAGQLNTDSLNQYHGMGAGTGDYRLIGLGTGGTITTSVPSTHFTNPNEDLQGDACDLDDDNDSLLDFVENPTATVGGGMTMTGWSTTSTSQCRARDVAAAPLMAIDPLRGDSDVDLVLDGRECEFRSRPDLGNRTASNCPAAIPAAAVVGCAQPGNSLTAPCSGQDPDSDQLCLPRSSGLHSSVELRYRTHSINIGVASQNYNTDGCTGGAPGILGVPGAGDADTDSDQDTYLAPCLDGGSGQFIGLVDGDEILFYGTHPTRTDSDRDGCMDNEEVADVNGSGNVNAGDTLLLANVVNHVTAASNPMDTGADGTIDNYWMVNFDLDKSGGINSGDILAVAKPQGASTANCPFSNLTNGFSTAEAPVAILGFTTQ